LLSGWGESSSRSIRPNTRIRPLHVTLVLMASLLAATPAAASPQAGRARAAKVTLTRVSVSGAKVTIAGRVKLPVSSAKERRRSVIWLTLTSGTGRTSRSERFSARLNARSRFTVSHTTRFGGLVALSVLVEIAGKASGAKAFETLRLAPQTTATTPAATTTTPGRPPPALPGLSPGTPLACTTQSGALDGTFELTAATDNGGVIGGSWFEMLIPGGAAPLLNSNSPLANQDYTPLSPGSDGGLQTFAYQPAPSPAFAEEKGGKPVGNALASRIMQPQEFEGYDFSVVTQSSDPQSGEADPLAQLTTTGGQLAGELTAWAVGWNGQWFNQGAPKPDGSLTGGTTAVSGSFDATSCHYVLEWKSLIVGGPFAGFVGAWHLEGTFLPAA
jgi:hypothetical protein